MVEKILEDVVFDLTDEDREDICSHVRRDIVPDVVQQLCRDDGAIGKLRAQITADVMTSAMAEVKAHIKPVIKQIEVKLPNKKVVKVDGRQHAAFEDVLLLASQRMNVLMVGPAGCGKTHLAEQVAKSLGLSFAFVSCSAGMSEGHLLGRLLPTGKGGQFEYITSEFVRRYENGGVFLFDEIDAADSNAMLVINPALANGYVAVPNRPGKPIAKRHPDFICLAAANTFGAGADRQYVGRNQMDESTLDRFRIGQIEMDYDSAVEEATCPDAALRNRLLGYRMAARSARLRRVVSTRFMQQAYAMKQAGWSDERIDQALFCGWSPDEIRKVKG